MYTQAITITTEFADRAYLPPYCGLAVIPSASHAWTRSAPCFQSTTTDDRICVFLDAGFAGGRGTSFVMTAKRAAYLATHPAFTDPDSVKDTNQDLVRTIPAKYDIKEFPGKGMGLVANDHIRRGDLIMANTASLMIDYRAFNELPREQYMQLQAYAVDFLPAPHRAALLNLSIHDGTNLSHIAMIDKITTTNAFDIDPDEGDDDQDNRFFVVFPEIARMNHDCRPNADYYFDHATLTQYIHAIRPISPGEEITLSYIDPAMKRSVRQKRLRTWGFQCVCHHCTQERARVEASDARIKQINDIKPDFRNWEPDSRASPQMAELLISLSEQEQLWGMMYEAYALAALEYNGVGDPWTAIKYARLAVEWGIWSVGEKQDDVVEMARLAEDPLAHWSWMMRSKRSHGWEKKAEVRDDDDDDDDDE
ncbi:hypothetical protein B0T19DRAFT_449237 [Cercophora scortea]|uniref:SET domain-containing protein n=1 Tax=Cercophora scortea TaxID=314031 RepID=A0AAE0IZV6_9PEZI|nr:hypothetical protein B0T19DRAFT_449237 [Cercophora scortea]